MRNINFVKSLIIQKPILTDKEKIINIFKTRVKGKKFQSGEVVHCGSEGQWLEIQMGLTPNSRNEPDIYGYEMKKYSTKITFGDFSASEYLFSSTKNELDFLNNLDLKLSRNDFIRFFGNPNPKKHNRYSWSGSCIPRYGLWNDCGQILFFDEQLDLRIEYCYSKDKRVSKFKISDWLKSKKITIAIWKKDKLEKHINNKFNMNGFFICKKNSSEEFEQICFGKSFNFIFFVEYMKNGNIIFDSGMYIGNNRNYSNFRSGFKNFWENLIIEKYS
jgi:hypothetical protein